MADEQRKSERKAIASLVEAISWGTACAVLFGLLYKMREQKVANG